MAEVTRVLKVRIYPNAQQETLIRKTIGCSRFIYNNMLAEKRDVYERLQDDKDQLRQYKYKTERQYKEEYDWLSEVDSVALQQSRMDLNRAFKNFFDSVKSKTKKQKFGYPRFKSKRNGGSYRTIARYIEMDTTKRKVRLPKLGWVTYRDSREPKGEIKSVTVSMTPTGKFFAAINYRVEFIAPTVDLTEPKSVGLDMEMKGGFADSQGNHIQFPRWYRDSIDKLKIEQKKLSRKVRGSSNWHKQRRIVAKYHEKVVNQRKDFLHKLSRSLVANYNLIAIEDLNLRGMAKAHFGKSVADNGWATFVRFLEYKTQWYGSTIYKVGRFFPSSKRCSECHYVNHELTLSDREWKCPTCGTHHDRDINAAVNIELEALASLGLDESRGGARPSLEESWKTRTSVLASA